MSKLKLTATAFCMFAGFTVSFSSPPAALAHKGAMGIVKERMDKFEASEKATKRIKQALSRGETAVVTAEAEFLISWAREMESYFPENSNQTPSEASEDPRAIRGAFKEMTKSCKSCHQQFRED